MQRTMQHSDDNGADDDNDEAEEEVAAFPGPHPAPALDLDINSLEAQVLQAEDVEAEERQSISATFIPTAPAPAPAPGSTEKEAFYNEGNTPNHPFVAATLLSNNHNGHHEDIPAEPMPLIVLSCEATANTSCNNSQHQQQQQQQFHIDDEIASRVIVPHIFRVYLDDDQDEGIHSENTPMTNDNKNLPQLQQQPRWHWPWRLLLLIIVLVVGLAIGLCIGLLRKRTLSQTTTGTTSISPSMAPSSDWCDTQQDITLKWTNNNLTTPIYNFAVALQPYQVQPQRSWMGITTDVDFFNQKFTIRTFIVSEYQIESISVQEMSTDEETLDVQSMAVSDDGVTLVLGISSYYNELTDSSIGACIIFQRLFNPDSTKEDNITWTRTHDVPIPGTDHGSVYDIALSTNGSVFAIMAMNGFVEPSRFVQAYSLTPNGVVPMGEQLFYNDTFVPESVKLSGDGTRLFIVPMAMSSIQILDYSSLNSGTWQSSGQVMVEASSSLPNIQVSRDGNTLVVGSYNCYPVEIYTYAENAWTTFDSVSNWDQSSNICHFRFSQDGNYLFLIGMFATDDETKEIRGEWFQRHGPNGFEAISSPIALPEINLEKVFLNEYATQVVFMTISGMLGYQRMCSTLEIPADNTAMQDPQLEPSVSLSPTGCMSDLDFGWYTNVTEDAEVNSFFEPLISISNEGSALVVASALDRNKSIHFVTFHVWSDGISMESDVRLDQSQNVVFAMELSGDGNTLLFGVNSYLQNDGTVGGAFLVYRRANRSWQVHGVVETGGGFAGTVFEVSSSTDGSIVAFSAGEIDGDSYADVYAVNETGLWNINKIGPMDTNHRTNETSTTPLYPFTQIAISGRGDRLFIISRIGDAGSFDFDFECACWSQVGQTIVDRSLAKVQVSFDGNTILFGIKNRPIRVYDFDGTYWTIRNSSSSLDESSNESLELVALANDGQSVFVAKTYSVNAPGNASMATEIIWDTFADVVSETFNLTLPLNTDQYSVGHLYTTTRDGVGFIQVESNLPLLPGMLKRAIMTTNGDLFVVTKVAIAFYARACL